MKSIVKPLTIIAVIAAAVAGLIWYFTRPQPVKVVLSVVERGRVEATVANTRAGTVKARTRAKLAPTIGGQIVRLPVREGERVTTGQVLLQLWNKDLEAQLELAKSEAASAQAKADEARLLAELGDREAKRLLKLQKTGLASDEVVDQAVAEAKAREAACRASKATVKVAESRVDVARAAIEKTLLTAPFDGIIAELNAELGEYVMPSPPGIPTPPAVDLIDDRNLYVLAPIDEIDAAAIRVDLKARITLDAFPGRTFDGRVLRIAPYVLDREKQARTVDVEVAWDSGVGEGLLAGYSADVEIVLSAKHDTLRVPTEAVLEGSRVLVYQAADGVLVERTFEPGLSNWKFTEALSGLEEGDSVVVSLEREGVVAGAVAVPEPVRREL